MGIAVHWLGWVWASPGPAPPASMAQGAGSQDKGKRVTYSGVFADVSVDSQHPGSSLG